MILPRHDSESEPSRRWMQNRPAGGGSETPASTAVLIPLVISMVLIFLGVGIALAFYINYRRKYRRWLDEFRERRAREERERVEQEKKDSVGPAWWEVEVGDDDDDDEDGCEKRAAQAEWNPVAVTYHHEPTKQDDKPTTTTAATPSPGPPSPPAAPEKVEMTVLIAMPSPTPMRSRRTSPASSVPSLTLSPSSTWRSIMSAGEREGEEELPEVQLATVMIPVKQHET